jgi:exo-1,4-beta-D-glucosaminidase
MLGKVSDCRCGLICGFVLLSLAVLVSRAAGEDSPELRLASGWAVQSSCKVKATGAEVSRVGFPTQGWHTATVPTTVVSALVAEGTYPDPYSGKNLALMPGSNYADKNQPFALQDMPRDSPFRCSWWYRTEFSLPEQYKQRTAWLHFDGINYRANIWVNGQKLADAKDVAGTFRTYEFEASKLLRAETTNVVAVEVFAPEKTDLAMTSADWYPMVSDKNMGLWRDVYFTSSGAVTLRHPFVKSVLDANYKTAALTISADLRNTANRVVHGTLRVEMEDIRISQSIALKASESRTITLTPEQYPQLRLEHPRLWWPNRMGSPNLYNAKLSFEVGGEVSDSTVVRFGVREVKSELTKTGSLLFKINGRNVLIRGAGWSPDMLSRSTQKVRADLAYTRDMGLNTVRLEGPMESDEFLDLADQMGVLVFAGWSCCSPWERWKEWTPEHHQIAAASLRDQIRRLRNHPGSLAWLYGSDNPPPPEVERMYLDILRDEGWPNPSVSSAIETPSKVTGASGVKMSGPYEYEPPIYWLADKEAGGAYGFNTETSPGPAIPPLESLKRFIPPDHLWPIDEFWDYHTPGDRFPNLDIFRKAMANRYGEAKDLDDFLRKSQAMTYEGQRAMFEAYARNKYASTGVIQWMLNNGWPGLYWHLYDFYLVPAGGYFGTKKACEAVHVQYSYDDNSVAVINGSDQPMSGLRAKASIYNINAEQKASREVTLDVAADSSTRALELQLPGDISQTYFLKLELRDSTSKLMSDNFYWLSAKPDALDWATRLETVFTPQSGYADLKQLNGLKEVKLATRVSLSQESGDELVHVLLDNSTSSLAFMVHLRVSKSNGEDVVPIFWEDNYFSLLPGEEREVSARFSASEFNSGETSLVVDGWNAASSSESLK